MIHPSFIPHATQSVCCVCILWACSSKPLLCIFVEMFIKWYETVTLFLCVSLCVCVHMHAGLSSSGVLAFLQQLMSLLGRSLGSRWEKEVIKLLSERCPHSSLGANLNSHRCAGRMLCLVIWTELGLWRMSVLAYGLLSSS